MKGHPPVLFLLSVTCPAVREVKGFGALGGPTRVAEDLARAVGARGDLPSRGGMALLHTLQLAADKAGHTHLPWHLLRSQTARLLASAGARDEPDLLLWHILLAEKFCLLVFAKRMRVPVSRLLYCYSWAGWFLSLEHLQVACSGSTKVWVQQQHARACKQGLGPAGNAWENEEALDAVARRLQEAGFLVVEPEQAPMQTRPGQGPWEPSPALFCALFSEPELAQTQESAKRPAQASPVQL